jgi:hypothetical protein
MKLTYTCECGKSFTIYKGDLVGIPFNLLPKAIAQAMNHEHKKVKE